MLGINPSCEIFHQMAILSANVFKEDFVNPYLVEKKVISKDKQNYKLNHRNLKEEKRVCIIRISVMEVIEALYTSTRTAVTTVP